MVNFDWRLSARRCPLAICSLLLLLMPTTPWARCEDTVPIRAVHPAGLVSPVSPGAATTQAGWRDLTSADLIQLREVGSPDGADFSSPSPFAVSPDGRAVAYVVNRADLTGNGYCRALVVSRLDASGPPRVLDRGGELITIMDVQRGLYLASGAARTIVPVWSPDGRRVAYMRRDSGVTQAWVADADGSGARALTHSAVDVEALAWSSNGLRLLYGTREGAAAVEAALDREGRSGWLYDRRIMPDITARPATPANDGWDVAFIDLPTGATGRADTADSIRLLEATPLAMLAEPRASAGDGSRAWLARRDSSPLAPAQLTVSLGGHERSCAAAACAGGVVGIWWQGSEVLFLRREGWAKETMTLYRWQPQAGSPDVVMRTDDVLHGCVAAESELICTRENSSTPGKVVAINLGTGRDRVIFEPNPEFKKIRLGQVTRLKWRNNLGLEAWGDLVMPPGQRPDMAVPMVVVQYHSDGFLRGGTGDEYPIFLLAQRGIAVLSTERPAFFAAAFPQLKTWDEINAANQKDWSERRSLLSSVATGVRMAVERGPVDPARVGITGLSDGATTAAFALINTKTFAAAAISTCCMEPNTTATYGGIAWAEWLRGMGYPPASRDDPLFWRDMSLARNAGRIDTPLLMQLADSEFRLALEAFGALYEQQKPVEMHVFPDEFHVKWQPVHRRAVYERNLDWFTFWLQDHEDPDLAKAAQYARWRAFRAARDGASPSGPAPARSPAPR
jgi:dipeptidyl aminopeptidase/acylaminoacyl peptidase